MKKLTIAISLAAVLLFTGCEPAVNNETTEEKEQMKYVNISAEDAKKIMDTEKNYIILDVREKDEFREGHIKDAIVIPYTEIEARAEKELPDKNQLILVYCRSGRRSKIAAEAMVKLGYTNIKEFGGILDWPYEIVK